MTGVSAAKPLPAASEHAPVSVLNLSGRGVRTMIGCSCGRMPATPPASARTLANSHMAHRRTLGLPRAGYAQVVFGEGPWTGWTFSEWWEVHGGLGIDPYTGRARNLAN